MVRRRAVVTIAGSIVLVLAAMAGGQDGRDPVAGVWELISSKNLATGAAARPDNIAIGMRAIYLDGHFVYFTAAHDRAKLEQSPVEMTREQLLDRFRIRGQFGTYTVKGNMIVRKIMAAANPLAEGDESTSEYRLEQQTLVIIRTNPAQQKIEEQYRMLSGAK